MRTHLAALLQTQRSHLRYKPLRNSGDTDEMRYAERNRAAKLMLAYRTSALTRCQQAVTAASLSHYGKPDNHYERVVRWTVTQVADVHAELPGCYKPLAFLGTGLGLRQGEVFGLATTDSDLARGVVTVRRQVIITKSKLWFAPPKYGKEREVPLPDKCTT